MDRMDEVDSEDDRRGERVVPGNVEWNEGGLGELGGLGGGQRGRLGAGCDFFGAKGGKIRGIWQKGVQRSCIYI